MRPEARQCLADARAAAEETIRIATGDWQRNRVVTLAVERLLMIIGESFARLRAMDPDVLEQVTDARKIVGMRNVLVHGYDAIDPGRIRDAVAESLPKLVEEIDALL